MQQIPPDLIAQRKVLERALVKSIEELKEATQLFEEMFKDYNTADHKRWLVAYRWVVALNDTCMTARMGLAAFDLIFRFEIQKEDWLHVDALNELR